MTKEIAETIPGLNDQENSGIDSIVYCHLFGIIGDWYICGISEDRKLAFGYRNIAAEKEWEVESWLKNEKEWGTFSIPKLQSLVNEKFLKELDLRFLVVRDISWKPVKFSTINTKATTLTYPGELN
tara:strand:- start:517 stop:894 length:378 start_codon:yes stop_codon:yes gene_type:complete